MRIFSVLILLLFGSVFTGAGLMIAQETVVPTYLDWQDMQNWQHTTAKLTYLAESDNDTQASYRYTLNGIPYQGKRVYVAQFKDNIGNYHQQLYQRLNKVKLQQQAIKIWYNPENPQQSVIDRSMRWGLFTLTSVFCSIFILIGLLLIYCSFKTRPPGKITPAMHSAATSDPSFKSVGTNPQPLYTTATPWMERKAWRDNQIVSGAKSKLYGLWAAALIWSLICIPVISGIRDAVNKGNQTALVGLLFPVAGLILFYFAWKKSREWQRFGIITLRMDPFPGSIGGHVGGSLTLNAVKDFRTPYSIKLECLQSYISGSGKNRNRREKVLWAEQGEAETKASGTGLRLEFRFSVPDNLPEADAKPTNDKYYFWRLTLSAELKDTSLKRSYNIPVYKTGEQSDSIRHDISAQHSHKQQQIHNTQQQAVQRADFANTPLARAFRYRDSGIKKHFYYPMFRNKALTIIALVFGASFIFAAYKINEVFAQDGIMSWVMFIFSAPFGLVGLLAMIGSIYLPLNNLSVTLEHQQISVLRRLGFIPIYKQVITNKEIETIEIKSAGSTGDGINKVFHFKLIAHTAANKKVTIAEDIDGKQLAEHLKTFISKKISLVA